MHSTHFSRLFYINSDHIDIIRDALCSLVVIITSNNFAKQSSSTQSDHMLSSLRIFEESTIPLLTDEPHAQEAVYAFTQSMFGLITHHRITKLHFILTICCVITGIAAIIVMLMLLNNLIETKKDLDQTLVSCATSFQNACSSIQESA